MSTFLAFRNAAFSLLKPTVTHCPRPAFRAVQIFAPANKEEEKKKKKKDNRPPRDEEIEYPFVRLVSSETKRLTDPIRLSQLLSTLDRKKWFVQLVNAEQDPIPIVKVMEKKKEFQKAKEVKAKAREAAMANRHKEIQLTWGSTPSDMAHKLERAREELEKGLKVDLVFAPKKGQILPQPAERQVQIQEIVSMMVDVAKEWKPQDQGKTVTAVYLQGISVTSKVKTDAKIPKRIRRKEELKARDRLKSQRTNSEGYIVDIYQD
jgi:translation initiation factor IF-3